MPPTSLGKPETECKKAPRREKLWDLFMALFATVGTSYILASGIQSFMEIFRDPR